MFLQRYVHVVLDAFLGSYVKNIDPAALQISVWNGKIEVAAVELQPDAIPLPKQLRLVKGTLRQLCIELPWTNLANQPIRVDIKDVSLLLEVCADDRAASDSDVIPNQQRRQLLLRKRAALDAMEKAAELNERNKSQGESWPKSFLFKLLVKVLDNVQVHVQHLHLRMEDTVSEPKRAYAVGTTLEAIIIKSADEGWNYTMVGRGQQAQDSMPFIRKKIDINKLGIYWSLPLVPVPNAVLDDVETFAAVMRSNFTVEEVGQDATPPLSPPVLSNGDSKTFLSHFKPSDYIIHPLTVSMKLTVNDGDAKLPITHQELSKRVLSRLGTPWMVDTIDAIGDEAWSEFLATMPKMARERKYTLGFVFSEAWSVARDLMEEEDETPSVAQFKEALSSCMQWSLNEVDRVERCIVKYREAVVHVMEEKSTYIDAQACIDQISSTLNRQQYLSAISFISFVTIKRRQARYLVLRPKGVCVISSPRAWWQYAIKAVLLDVRERLAHVDWEALEKSQLQKHRYKELYLMLKHGSTFAATLLPPKSRLLPKELAQSELDELECVLDIKDLIKLRRAVRKDITDKEKEKEILRKIQSQRDDVEGASVCQDVETPASSRIWSYATWLTGAGRAAHDNTFGHDFGSRKVDDICVEDIKWSDQDTKDLYEAINYHPEEDNRECIISEVGDAATKKCLLHEQQHILYRFQLTLAKGRFELSLKNLPANISGVSLLKSSSEAIPAPITCSSHLIASLDDVDIQILVRPSCVEVGLQLQDALFCQKSGSSSLHDNISDKCRLADSSGTDFFLQRMEMGEVLEYHPVGVRNQMSSVRLRHCERKLPLMHLNVESERKLKDEKQSTKKRESGSDNITAAAHLIRVSFVTQPIKCNVNLMFLLDVVAVFSRPTNVDLSSLEHSAWKRAQTLQRYSTAQLRGALARRTMVNMRLDVISPLINVIQSPPIESGIPTGKEVSLLVFLGHLKAQTKHPSELFDNSDVSSDSDKKEIAARRMFATSSIKSLYDVLEIGLTGIEVQVIDGGSREITRNIFRKRTHSSTKAARHYLLEKTSLTFSFLMSVTPDDPSIPLVKFFGGVNSVNLNLSASSFRSLVQLLQSFGDNFSAHAQQRLDKDAAIHADVSSRSQTSTVAQTVQGSKPRLVRTASSNSKHGVVYLSSSGSGGRYVDNSLHHNLAEKYQSERQKTFKGKNIDDQDLLKLWKRIICQLQFGVSEINLTLRLRDMADYSGKIVRLRVVDISTQLNVRSYDRRLEFKLGTFFVEDILLSRCSLSSKVKENKRFLVRSGNQDVLAHLKESSKPRGIPLPSSEQLIQVTITSITSDAVLPKEYKNWKQVRHPALSVSSDEHSVWQDPLITSLSADARLQLLTIDVYQDTLAEVFLFFFKHNKDETESTAQQHSPPSPPPSLRSTSEGSAASKNGLTRGTEEQSVLSSVDMKAAEDINSSRFGEWIASSLLDNLPGVSPESEKYVHDPAAVVATENVDKELPASMQLRLHVEGLSLFLHLSDKERPKGMPSAFAALTAQQFCCCVQRFPRYLSMFAYLTSLKICDLSLSDQYFSEIVSHGKASSEPKESRMRVNRNDRHQYDGDIAVGHAPTLSEILTMLDDVPAVFSCAAQLYGADAIQEPWHPGYSSRYSVRLKSPRIRFLYSFVNDMRNYLLNGELLETILLTLSRKQDDMLWEGDFQLGESQKSSTHVHGNNEKEKDEADKNLSGKTLGSDVVSMFPLVDIRLEDTVMEMPPHRMSSESLVLRLENFRISNENVIDTFLGMENRVVAKVLLNSSLKQVQLNMKALRVVSVIFVDRNDVSTQPNKEGFVTQSLLGLTNYSLSVDFRSNFDLKLNLTFLPVRLVCNQEQYAFVLRVPLQNYRERSRYHFSQPTKKVARLSSRQFSLAQRFDRASTLRKVPEGSDASSKGTSVSEAPDISKMRQILLDLYVPEITVELLEGQHGYHPSNSGDLDMVKLSKTNGGSICILALSMLSGPASYSLSNNRFTANVDIEGVHIRDSRVNSKMSVAYRDVVVFERYKEGLPKAIKFRFESDSYDVDVSTIGFETAFTRRESGFRTPRAQFRSVSSRARFGLFGSELSLWRADSGVSAYSPSSSTMTSYRANSIVSGEEEMSTSVSGTEGRMEFAIDVAGFKVIPSNIFYDIIQFLTTPSEIRPEAKVLERSRETPDEVAATDSPTPMLPHYRRIRIDLNLGPSALLLVENPHKNKSRALMLSWESAIILNYLRQTNEDKCLHIEDNEAPAHSRNQLSFCICLDNVHATSRLSEESVWASEQSATAASADCLKPINMETVIQMDLHAHFLRFRTTFDRVMELRFGYLDFCTMLAAVEHILCQPFIAMQPSSSDRKKRSASGSSTSSFSGGGAEGEASTDKKRSQFTLSSLVHNNTERQRTAALYGSSLIYLVSASFRGRLETRPVVGFYSSTWRKRYLVLPYTAQQRQLVQSVAFRILPAPGSRRQIGDEIYYGDRIILDAVIDISDNDMTTKETLKEAAVGSPTACATTQSTLIQKYDQLGAIGYLGPEGSAGAFETTIWKHGSTMFNSDKSVVYDRELIVFEELTIYRSFSKGTKFGATDATDQQMDFNSARSGPRTEGAHTVDTTGARGGGYLMFNGVGDAPIPFALSIVSSKGRSRYVQRDEKRSGVIEDTDTAGTGGNVDEKHNKTQNKRKSKRKKLYAYSTFFENLKIVELTLPGVNATVINDFHNMLLPLLHFRMARLHADIRGRLDNKFTALTCLRFGIQAYNSQLAVWEPVLEDFEVNMAYHGMGGVLCDYCMSERQSVSPTGAALRCDGMPLCLFRSSQTEVFTNAAAHSWESKNFIYRELLEQPDVQDGAKQANTFMIVVKDDFNINISRNVINVLVHFFALVTKATPADEALSSRLGPFIYVDNQSGIPFVVATHPSSSSDAAHTTCTTFKSSRRPSGSIEIPTEVPNADTNSNSLKNGSAMFNSNAWSRRRLSTMLNNLSSSDTKWIRVESGERVATDVVAHEAPAGCVTSPLRRLLWLKPQSDSQKMTSSKAIPVPIGYSNRSYLHLESSEKQRDSWHGESIICETVAEQGTLVLRLRGKIQLTNYFNIPIQVIYNDQRVETIEPDGKGAHYIPIQYLELGTIAFQPLLLNGKVQRSDPLSIAYLLRSNDSKAQGRSNRRQNLGSLELRKALTFYWDVHPNAESVIDSDLRFGVSLPPYQIILTATRKSERHETIISLRPAIILENLVPYELSYRTVCMKSEAEVEWVSKNAACFSGVSGKVSSGRSAYVPELDIKERELDGGKVRQIPAVVGLSLALPQIQLCRFSRWSKDSFIYGCESFCERIELNMRDNRAHEESAPVNKLTICVEVTQLEKLRSRALNALCPVFCRVFTEYWLIDRTSLSLAFYTADDYLIPSNHPGRLADEQECVQSSSVSLSVFSCESKQVVSKMKIGIKGSKGEREVQSEPFDISAVGVRGQIVVPTTRSRDARSLLHTFADFGAPSDGLEATFKQYEFGVMIEQGPEKFSRSRVVTLVPRYYLINTSNNFQICIRQECSTDPSAVIMLRPQEKTIFHWSDSRLPSRIQICFVLPDKRHGERDTVSFANSSQWSAPFELSSVGNFVLRVKSKIRPAPPCLPECFEGSGAKRAHIEDDEGVNLLYDADEYSEAESMLAEGIQLNVAVELHDPSFLVYLEEGRQISEPFSRFVYEESDKEHTLRVKHTEDEVFVPFKIKNECSNLALLVWQKTLVKDKKGNATISFEGGDIVLPFHTINYVPFRFSAFPTVFVQVQKMAGLSIKVWRKEHATQKQNHTHSSITAVDRRDKDGPISALSRAVSLDQVQAVASFEVQLKKLQRLPTIDVSEGVVKKRLWAEVLLDETTKTLLVTDMLPGYSGEHKRRRRATLLRSWKRYNTCIMNISHVLAAHHDPLSIRSDNDCGQNAPLSTKRVHFAADFTRVTEKDNANESGALDTTQEGTEAVGISPLINVEREVDALALCVRLVDATYLEEVFLQAGRSDLTSCQPFLTFSLKTEGEEARTKLIPQSTTLFPRWLPACNSRTTLSALILADEAKGLDENMSRELGSGVQLTVEIREADKILFGSSIIATARIPLQEYCAAAMIATKRDANYDQPVVEFFAPVRVTRTRGRGDRSSEVTNNSRIRFLMCCRRTLTTRSAAAECSGEGSDTSADVRALKEMLSAYQLKKELDMLVSSKSQLKLLLEREAVDTSTSGTNLPAALQSIPDSLSPKEKRDLGLPQYVDQTDEDGRDARNQNTNSVRGSTKSATSEESIGYDMYEEMRDEKQLTAVLIGVSNLQIPMEIIRRNYERTHGTMNCLEPKLYCTITYQESTRSALSATAKPSTTSETTNHNTLDVDGLSSSFSGITVSDSIGSHAHLQKVRTFEFSRGQTLGLDLVYQNGRVLVQGVVCDGPCGVLVYEGKLRIGDTVVAANNKSIVNLHRDASFAVIEKAMHWGEGVGTLSSDQISSGKFSLSFLFQPTTPELMTFRETSVPPCAQPVDDGGGTRMFDVEWNRRVEFVETANTKPSAHDQVLVRVYLRNETSDHGLSASQESSIVPFLYFFGDDAMMDHLDHSKQDSRFDVLLAECWVPLPPSTISSTVNVMSMDGNSMAEPPALTFNERICALYSPQQRTLQRSALNMIGQLRLALKWDYVNPLRTVCQIRDLSLHFQLEVARICISCVDDGAWSSVTTVTGPQRPQEVLCISLSDQNASAGVQLSYDQISDGKQVLNARIGHFQIDNQLLDTNYPVLLRPMRLADAQMQEEGCSMAREKTEKIDSGNVNNQMLLPTVQFMAVFSRQPNVIQFDYIFGQLQELEIKLEDAALVALAHVFSGVEWSYTASKSRASKKQKQVGDEFGSNLALKLLEIEWSNPTMLTDGHLGSARSGGGVNSKVLLRWLLLCPVKVNITFTSTADRSSLLSLLSPDMSSVLSTLISAAAALVSNLDQAPIRVPEFYVENLLETTHTLAFYAMQHYLHHGLRSWYSIMGSVDFLGNPIGLVSTLGTGVKDFFYTPAQMLLENENGLRIDNLRTGMTKGSKSLLRNTAVGIFHTTGKITETLGKGIALLAMDEQYNVQRQRASTRQAKRINDLGDAIAEGSKGLVGGVWDGIKGVVAAPVRGAEQDGAGGFVVGIGKGVAGLIVKPTAGFLDLLTSLSRGAKTSAESLDGTDRNTFDTVTRFRLPRRICSDGVLVSFSEREARGYAVLLLTSLDATDDYVYHLDYGIEPHRGLLLLTDKRLICLSGKNGQKLWEVALDSTLEIVVENSTLKIGQTTSPSRTYNIECDSEVAATNFRIAVESARVDVSATRYLLLNLEKSQEESRISGNGRFKSGISGILKGVEDRTDIHVLMESVQDTTVSGLSNDDLQSQPLRSVRVELCHLQNKDAHANVPDRTIDKLLSFSVFQIQVYGGPYQWTVFRRFSEFRALCAKLGAAGYILDGLPPLPPRTFLPSTREPVAKYRQEALNMFLQAAIMHSAISRSAVMLEFLTRDAREVRVSLPPLSPTNERSSPRAGDSP
ncbi:putative vacuolar protein sorting-associated protein [Plasmopara halstedii]